jgi:6-phosphogluconolactonase
MFRNWIPSFFLCTATFLAFSPESSAATDHGRLFAGTNEASGNRIAVYKRGRLGLLTFLVDVPTGGRGTGGDLGSQGSITLSASRSWLLVANAGDSTLSAFRIDSDGMPHLTDVVASGGTRPRSVTIRERTVFVLNAGDPNNVTGFDLSDAGTLTPIPSSTRALSGAATDPAQVQFSPDGTLLVVTEKATNRIDLFPVDAAGGLGPIRTFPSAGVTPFGFAFSGDSHLVVAEAFGGAPQASAVSSYELFPSLSVVSASVPTTETAAGWVAIPRGGRFAYVTNAGSDTITGYEIGCDGALTILDPEGVTAVADDHPVDLAFSLDGVFLFALNSHHGTISSYQRTSDGSLLQRWTTIGGLPSFGAAGLAGY